MTAYPYQTIGHDASISAAPEDDATVRIEIAISDMLTLTLHLWPETAADLARDLADPAARRDRRSPR